MYLKSQYVLKVARGSKCWTIDFRDIECEQKGTRYQTLRHGIQDMDGMEFELLEKKIV